VFNVDTPESDASFIAQAVARAALKEAEVAVLEARKHVKALEQEALLQAKAAEQAAREANAKLSEVSDVRIVFLKPLSLADRYGALR
jgi:hypothetical protein